MSLLARSWYPLANASTAWQKTFVVILLCLDEKNNLTDYTAMASVIKLSNRGRNVYNLRDKGTRRVQLYNIPSLWLDTPSQLYEAAGKHPLHHHHHLQLGDWLNESSIFFSQKDASCLSPTPIPSVLTRSTHCLHKWITEKCINARYFSDLVHMVWLRNIKITI